MEVQERGEVQCCSGANSRDQAGVSALSVVGKSCAHSKGTHLKKYSQSFPVARFQQTAG